MGFEIILHIGRHKSGTSSLQNYLHQHAGIYSSQGTLYPQACRRVRRGDRIVLQMAHHALALSFQNTDRNTAEEQRRQWLGELRKELTGHQRLILSSETFGNFLKRDQIQPLRAFLEALGPERITVIVYLREYLDYINSGYRQRIQNSGDLIALSEYPLLRNPRYSLAAWLAAWQSVGTVVCRHFNRNTLHQGDVVADFCFHTDLEHHHGVYESDRNPSIGGNLLFLKCALNFLGRHRADLYEELGEYAARDPAHRSPLGISKEVALRIREGSDWNTTLNEYFGEVPLPSFENLPPCPEHSTLENDLDSWATLLQRAETVRSEIEALITKADDWFQPYSDHR